MNRILLTTAAAALALLAARPASALKTGFCPGVTCSSPGYPVVTHANLTTNSNPNQIQHTELVPIFWEDCAGCNGPGL